MEAAMARSLSLALVLTLMASFARTAPLLDDDDDVKAIVEKAIKAHGGEQKLAEMKTGRTKSKGIMTVNDQKYAVTAESVAQSEDTYKLDFRIDTNGTNVEVHCVLNKDKAWRTIAGETMEIDGDTLKNILAEVHARKIQ
jgi:hypothetical protein